MEGFAVRNVPDKTILLQLIGGYWIVTIDGIEVQGSFLTLVEVTNFLNNGEEIY